MASRLSSVASDAMTALCRTIPKTELHMHLEGSLEPALVRKIAARNGKLADLPPEAEMFAAYKEYESLEQFLEVYYLGATVLQTKGALAHAPHAPAPIPRQARLTRARASPRAPAADFYDMTYEYLKRAADDGVAHIEPFIDLEEHLANGVAAATVFDGIRAALADAERDLGITSGLIVCFQRTRGCESALGALEALEPHIQSARIVAVGCDSDYVDDWPALYKPAYERARRLGLKLVAHAGEVDDGRRSLEHMRVALDALELDRVDHGVRAWEDPTLLADVVARAICLTASPLSNVKLGLFSGWEPCARAYSALIRAGAKVTVNSDDPAFFGSIGENFVLLQQHCGLTAEEVGALCKNAANGSFASDARKAALCAAVDDAVRAYHDAEENAAKKGAEQP